MGGYATSSKPDLWDPGTIDPRLRAFVVDWEGGWIGKPEIKAPPAVDLDRVALLWFAVVYDPWSGRWALDYVPVWADLSDSDRYTAALVWRQAFILGALPEDELFETSPGGSPAVGWPSQAAGAEQRVYMWRFAGGTLYQQMQIQKWDGAHWLIFNKWGQNLTFVKVNGAWTSGWDLGDWLTQNSKAVVDAFQVVAYAVMTLMSAGAGAPVTAATAAGLAAVKAAGAMVKAAIAGDAGEFVKDFLGVVANVAAAGAAVHVDLGAEMRDALPEFARTLPDLPAIQGVARIVGDAADYAKKVAPTFNDVRAAIARLGLPAPGENEIAETIQKAVPGYLQVWAHFGRRDAAAGQADDRIAAVPWYARGPYTVGFVLGEQERAEAAAIHEQTVSMTARPVFMPSAFVKGTTARPVFMPSAFVKGTTARAVQMPKSRAPAPSSPPVRVTGTSTATPVTSVGAVAAAWGPFVVPAVAVGFLAVVSGVAAVRLWRR